ncbi:MAG TPA: DegT/DnrJ/EryC1/StrS family aminotransferase [Candidatus Polarisedimenticolaceae bacterium]|nr:DegT/DnrJ/EryC1/StrS family aminotransferase [Candidatus Polarisedimenticolaceae bacterium]
MVPYFDYRPEYRRLQAELDAAWTRVIGSGRLILGPEVEAFEREFASWVDLPHAVGTNSGTDALTLALRALGVGPGDEVITVANAGVPPVAAVRAVGAVPRLVDVDPASLLLDPERLDQAWSPRTRCVLPIHLYGQAAPLEPIVAFARRRGLCVVEDCAQAHGTLYRGRHVGRFGEIGCFSFYPTKNLGAYGDGGLCVTADPRLAARLRQLRMYGFRDDRQAHLEGVNSRLDELQAAVLRVKLRHLDDALRERRALAAHYQRGLAGSAYELPRSPEGTESAFHLLVVLAADRARLQAALDQAGIGWGVHYADPIHRMPAYRWLGYAVGDLPVSERACASVLSLPLYAGLKPEQVDRVVQVLRQAV